MWQYAEIVPLFSDFTALHATPTPCYCLLKKDNLIKCILCLSLDLGANLQGSGA